MKSEIDENVKMQRITKLLEKGGTMLASSHECGAPMFRYQGKVLCPVCDAGIEDVKKAPAEPDISSKMPPLRKEKVPEMPFRMPGDYARVAAMTKKKIQEIAESLENETDMHRIKEKMECMELGIRILKLME